jgi:RNA polymerase sigma-70 factor (ECF subfamily)
MRQDERLEEGPLIARAKNGDMDAYESLIRLFQHRIYRLCWRMTGAHQSADDMAQETFIKAYQALSRFRDGQDFYPWIRRIAVNMTLNYLHVRKREEPLGDREPSVPDELPQDEFQRREAEDRFQEAWQALPSDQRAVFTLRVVENQSYREIAESLHLAPGTVMSRLNRARRKLKESLADFLGRRRG